MRRVVAAFALLLLAGPSFADSPKKTGTPANDGIAWESDYEVAKQKSLLEGKPLFVDISTEWCHYCQDMKKFTFPREDVKKFLATAICFHLDPDKGKDGKKMKEAFKVTGYPTLLMFDPQGTELKRFSGAPPADSFVEGFTVETFNSLNAADKGNDGKTIAECWFRLHTFYPDQDLTAKASEIVKRHESDAAYTDTLKALTAKYESETGLAKANLQLQQGKKKDAIETLKAVVTNQPDEPKTAEAKALLKKLGVKLDEPKKEEGSDKK